MAGFALGPARAGRLGITPGFERTHTSGPAVRCRMAAAAIPTHRIRPEPLCTQIASGRAGGWGAADVLDAQVSHRWAVRIPRALPAHILDADRTARIPGAVRILKALKALALLVAHLARWTIGVLSAGTAHARLVVGTGPGRDTERPRRRTVRVGRARETVVIDAAATRGAIAVAITVLAAQHAGAPRAQAPLRAHAGEAVTIDRAALANHTRPEWGQSARTGATAIRIGLPKVQQAVLAVVEARARSARLVWTAAPVPAALGVASRAGPLFLGLLSLLPGQDGRPVQCQAEAKHPSSETAQGDPARLSCGERADQTIEA